MSHVRHAGAGLLMLALAISGCQKQASAPTPGAQRKAPATAAQPGQGGPESGAAEPEATAQVQESAASRWAYDRIGKRDPFRSFILDRLKERDDAAKSPLEQFDLSQLVVAGVVWDTDQRRALVLDPSGQNYIVQEGDPIGKNDGRVVRISDNVLTVREAYMDFHGATTTKEIEMRVRQSQGG